MSFGDFEEALLDKMLGFRTRRPPPFGGIQIDDDKDIQVDCEMAFATTTVSQGETATVTLDVLGEYQCSNLNFSAGQPNGFFLTVIAG